MLFPEVQRLQIRKADGPTSSRRSARNKGPRRTTENNWQTTNKQWKKKTTQLLTEENDPVKENNLLQLEL